MSDESFRDPTHSHRQRTTQLGFHAQSYSGPIPPAEQLARYARIRPDFPDRILRMAESNAAHRQRLEGAVIRGNLAAQARGQWFAFVLSLLIVGVGAWLVYSGRTSTGLWVIFGDALSLAGVFIGARWIQMKERRQRRLEFHAAGASPGT